MTTRCAAKTKSGSRCRARPLHNDSMCWSHSPHNAERRARARSDGGRARAIAMHRREQIDITKLGWWALASRDDLINALRWCARRIAMGKLDPRSANSLVAVLGALRGSLVDAELDARLDRIERKIGGPRRAA